MSAAHVATQKNLVETLARPIKRLSRKVGKKRRPQVTRWVVGETPARTPAPATN